MKATHLRVDYLDSPLGLGNPRPEFSWFCDGGVRQTAYRLVVTRGEENICDTGRVSSSAMTHIPYEGKELHSRDRLTWRVQLWEESDSPGEWSESRFEMGLLQPQDWTAGWITGSYPPKHSARYPVDYFCKRFAVGKKVAHARLYATACGLYTARLNGKAVGEGALLPGCTDYNKRLHYQTFDVTALLQTQNVLELQLADGWYRGSIGCFGNVEVFGNETKLLCQLELEYGDGTRQVIGSDASFKWSNDGPLRFADLKDGEVYDAARRPSYGSYAKLTTHAVTPTAADLPMPRCKERFAGKRLTTPQGRTVFDFGQNLAGFVAFAVQGRAGQRIRIKLGETLDENGEFTQFNFQKYRPDRKANKLEEFHLMCGQPEKIKGPLRPTPRQEIVFVCSGGQDHYQTQFALFGFRYALVETDKLPDDFSIESIAGYTDLEQTGQFRCSHEKINRLFRNVVWSMKSNYLEVPTDCPTRERLAWTGDAQLFLETGAYLRNVAPFFRKWLHDLQDAQGKDGKLPAVVPLNGMDMMYVGTGASVGWGESCILIPCRLWQRYGDVEILRQNYPMMQKYAAFLMKHTGHKDRALAKGDPLNKYVYEKGTQLGEWMEPDEFRDIITATSKIPQTEVCTAYEEISHTPLFIYDPVSKLQSVRCTGLTSALDLPVTLLDYFDLEITKDMQGVSLLPLLREDTPVRQELLFGFHAGITAYADGRYVYFRAPLAGQEQNCYDYTLMPTRMRERFAVSDLQRAELNPPLPNTKGCPVLKTPARTCYVSPANFGTKLFDVQADPHQAHPLEDPALEAELAQKMTAALHAADAPAEQFDRLGLPADGAITAESILRTHEKEEADTTPAVLGNVKWSAEARNLWRAWAKMMPPEALTAAAGVIGQVRAAHAAESVTAADIFAAVKMMLPAEQQQQALYFMGMVCRAD